LVVGNQHKKLKKKIINLHISNVIPISLPSFEPFYQLYQHQRETLLGGFDLAHRKLHTKQPVAEVGRGRRGTCPLP